MAPTLDDLLRTQDDLRGRIERFLRNTLKLGQDKLTHTMLQQRRWLLETYWRDFTDTHRAIIRIADPACPYLVNGVFDTVEANYLEHLVELSERIQRAERVDKKAIQDELATGHSSASEPALPTITLPTFSGDLLRWESFRDQFRALVHDSRRLTKVQKLQYLKTSLTGDAAKMLAHTPITEGNYEGAWTSLERRYGNRRILSAAHLRRLVQCPPATKSSPTELKRLLDEFRQAREALAALEKPVDHWDEWFSFLLTEKLDTATRLGWETALPDPTAVPTFDALVDYLENRVHAITSVHGLTNNAPATSTKEAAKKPMPNNARGRVTMTVTSTDAAKRNKTARPCPSCAGTHTLSHCGKFRKLTSQDRKAFVHKVGLCICCLNPGHALDACKSIYRCLVCDGSHHTMLHDGFRTDATTVARRAASETDHPTTSTSAAYAVRTHRVVLLATAQVRLESDEGRSTVVRALLDPGSESSFVSENVAQMLQLRRRRVRVLLTGYQEKGVGVAKHEVTITLSSEVDTSFRFRLDALVTRKVTSPTPSQPVEDQHWTHLQGLSLADSDFRSPKRVDVLLGADVCGHLFLENKAGPAGTPPLVRTPFGWAPLGPVNQPQESSTAPDSRVLHIRRLDDLQADLQRFWELEEVPTTSPQRPQDLECEEFFKLTHSRDATGRYTVRLPLTRTPTEEVGVPRHTALRIFVSSERRREKDDQLRTAYAEFMAEYLRLEHMEPSRGLHHNQGGNYLPHHAVWKNDGSKTKIRVVFNGSYVSEGRTALNEVLSAGPKLQTDLWLVLTRWRLLQCAFSADISKMFRQIRVHEDDRDWQRIVWRSEPSEEVKDFRLTTVTYGTAPAPYLALRVLQQLAEDEGERFPLGAEVLRRHVYVDDFLAGADDPDSAEEVRRQLIGILMAGGFPLDKWGLNYVPPQPVNDTPIKFLQPDKNTGALGLIWNAARDTLTLTTARLADPSPDHWTKRSILSETARLFDPLGWMAPVLINAKILLQDLWLSGLGWDEPVPETLKSRWISFRQELEGIKDIEIPRWVHYREARRNQVELHGFCDASERAYAAAVYIRVPLTPTKAATHLIIAKTKLAPTKLHSVPRLELCGALLLARLLTAVRDGLRPLQPSLHAWTDASVVLSWVQAHASRWKPFVAHRVAEIQRLLPGVTWRHLRTGENPADLATRGVTALALQEDSRWWRGPPWINRPPGDWPESSPASNVNVPEERRTVGVLATHLEDRIDLLGRWSSLSRLLRIVAYLRRFLKVLKRDGSRPSGHLTAAELDEARITVHRLSQAETFEGELQDLKSGKPVKISSPLNGLRPFLDQHGVIRVGGRLGQSSLKEDQRHPVVIDRRSPLATLIVHAAHKRTLHGGLTLTRCTVRQTHWIPRDHNLVKRILRSCVRCTRFQGATCNQQMGVLPAVRVQPARAFQHSGVDYAGPITLLVAKGRGHRTTKGYISVFVCLCTKAVHLEVVSDLSSAAFIAAFRRFVARRGHCAKLLSDNSTTFRGADQQLKSMFHEASVFFRETAELLANDGTEWEFIPPYAPHFGGLWEAAVKSTKRHLQRSVGEHRLTFEEMATLLCQVEACLNSRPLSPLSDDATDLEVLTPNHLVTGSTLAAVPDAAVTSTVDRGLKRWTLIQRLLDQFWRKWRLEYLGQLQHLPKWRRLRANLAAGTLVLLKDDAVPPTKWPMARVVDVHEGPDGLVRVATLKTATRTLTRAVTRLVPLVTPPITADDQPRSPDVKR